MESNSSVKQWKRLTILINLTLTWVGCNSSQSQAVPLQSSKLTETLIDPQSADHQTSPSPSPHPSPSPSPVPLPSASPSPVAPIPYLHPGNYEGILGTPLELRAVSADVSFNSPISAEIHIKSPLPAEPIALLLTEIDINDVLLSASLPTPYLEKPFKLTRTKGHCYASAPETPLLGTPTPIIAASLLCIEEGEIQLLLNSFTPEHSASFCLSQHQKCRLPPAIVEEVFKHELPPKEPPLKYSIDQLMERARKLNFNNLAEFEKVIQAKLTAQNSKLNLLRHLNINSMVALSGTTPQPLILAIGDLAPFFLPNRWEQSASLIDQSKAEQDAFLIMQAISMNTVENLSLMILRDEAATERLKDNYLSIIAIRDEILNSELNPGSNLPVGTSDEINIILKSISRTINTLKEAIAEERLSLSQASGFMNPLAVADVLPVIIPPLVSPISPTIELTGNSQPIPWENAAIERSLQLTQLDHLKEAAKHTHISRFYQWMDPAGDNTGGLGLGLPSYVEISASRIKELDYQELAMKTQILKNVNQALVQSQLAFENYRNAVESSQIDQRRIARLLLNFRTGNSGSTSSFLILDLASSLQDKAVNDVNQVDGLFTQFTLLKQLEFLTFTGPYSPLLGEVHQ